MSSDEENGSGVVRAYLELTRLPNVFTAMADVAMGMLFIQAVVLPDLFLPAVIGSQDYPILGLLMAASALLYTAGMVLNDVFDFQLDSHQRPARPLPSGRVSLATARRLGWGLLVAGILCAGAVAVLVEYHRPVIVAGLLGGCIVLYDGWLKRTPLGPVGMGLCRTLNVLLGMSVVEAPWLAPHWLVAGGVGVYVAGVTWFARSEAAESSRLQLGLATLLVMLGIGLLAWFPSWTAYPRESLGRWYLIMGVFGILIGRRCVYAVFEPTPTRVQAAVTQCILSLIILDGVVTFAVAGTHWAVTVLLLLLPAVILGQWIKST